MYSPRTDRWSGGTPARPFVARPPPAPPPLPPPLLPLNVGPLYNRLAKDDRFGYIPQMAAATLGALNAESFCERVLRCAGHVLTEGNNLLGDEELEMLVVLRMNRNFMQFMRDRYGSVVKQAQPHGRTVLKEVEVINLDD